LKAISKVVQRANVAPLPPQKNLIQPLEPREPYLDTLENWWIGKSFATRDSASSLIPCMVRPGLAAQAAAPQWRHLRRDSRHARSAIRRRAPEPIEPHIEALRQAVLAGKFDAGLCADGDGDRIGAIDRDGSFINPHQIFALLVWHWRVHAICQVTLQRLFP